MNWTDERVELLTKLWADGLSASQIAAELGGGVSRNAVIGKVHRLKLSSRGKTTPTSTRPKKTAEANPTNTISQNPHMAESMIEPSINRPSRNAVQNASRPNIIANAAQAASLSKAAPLSSAAQMSATQMPNASSNNAAHKQASNLAQASNQANNTIGINNARAANRSMGATAFKMEFEAEAVVPMATKSSADIVVPMSRRLSLLQLNEHTCKWPEGDPLSEDFYFCGADSGEDGPYCAFHAKLAFQPVSERRRVRV